MPPRRDAEVMDHVRCWMRDCQGYPCEEQCLYSDFVNHHRIDAGQIDASTCCNAMLLIDCHRISCAHRHSMFGTAMRRPSRQYWPVMGSFNKLLCHAEPVQSHIAAGR